MRSKELPLGLAGSHARRSIFAEPGSSERSSASTAFLLATVSSTS